MTMDKEQNSSNQILNSVLTMESENLFFDQDCMTTASAGSMEMPDLDEMYALMKKLKSEHTQTKERTLITHPDNKIHIESLVDELNKSKDIHVIFPYRILYNEYMEKERATGKWLRNPSVLPDTKFNTWIDDLKNPPVWAKHFGLVKPEMEPVIYEFDTDGQYKFGDFRMALAADKAAQTVKTRIEESIFNRGVLNSWL